MKAIPGDESIRCRKCEDRLSNITYVDPSKYGLVPNRFGAILRKCLAKDCGQLWLGYMQELPKGGTKIIMKMIDKRL